MADILEELKSKFILYLRNNNYSSNSIWNYIKVLRFYKKFIQDNINKNDYFTMETAVKFKTYLYKYRTKQNKQLKYNTIQGHYEKVKRFHKYLLKNNYIFINPYELITPIKTQKQLIKKSIPIKDVEKILLQPNLNTHIGYRNRTMLELLYSTGMRREEIYNLNVYDVDINNGFIKVTGKGNKDRIIPIGKRAIKYLNRYITDIRPILLKDLSDNKLFISKFGKSLSLASIGNIIKKYIKMSGVNQKYSCHNFRHTCAIEMLKNKATIKHIQEMLGHENIGTTQIYTYIMPEDLKEVYKTTHPANWIFD